jgi:uncharacterized repeat protein (TIGR01451 family)
MSRPSLLARVAIRVRPPSPTKPPQPRVRNGGRAGVVSVASACLAVMAGLGLAMRTGPALGQAPAPGRAVIAPAPAAAPAVPALPTQVQIVRFHGPAGVTLEVLGPPPEAVPVGDGHGLATVGLRVGVGYRLRLSNLPDRPDAELFPVIEIVGHLHRPEGIDPARYPIRVAFTLDDLEQALDRGRLVTQVVYLEDPEQALPIALPKDEVSVVTVGPSEDPLKVAAALGRVMALVRTGGRKPSTEELNDVRGPGAVIDPAAAAGAPCPFVNTGSARCPLSCGPVTGRAPDAGRLWLPRDEYLCDGGDHGEPVHFDGTGGLRGIDPRDAVLRFNDGMRPRVLPTNTVCVYAPRFAEVRMSVGPNEALTVEGPLRTQINEHAAGMDVRQGPRRLVQNQGAQSNRTRLRASALAARLHVGETAELRVLSGYDSAIHIAGHVLTEGLEDVRIRQKAVALRDRNRAEGIKVTQKVVLTGIVEGAGEQVMSWRPGELVGVETPPNVPGLAVIKRVSAGEAEPGDTLTFVIQYRNMGNVPIRSVTVTDSLLPRLAYVPGSAQGPAGSVFTAGENRVGGTELRWELPAAIPPGAEGYVSFKTLVR